MSTLWRWTLALIAATTTTSCLMGVEVELRLESLRVVRLSEEPRWVRSDSTSIGGDPEKARALRIEMSSEADLVRLSKERALHVGYDVLSCDGSVLRDVGWATPKDLRVSDRWLDGGSFVGQVPTLESYRRPDGRISYFAFVPIAETATRAWYARRSSKSPNADFQLYDPEKSESDLCVVVRGGNMMGRELRSRPVVIPRQAITAKLAEMQSMPQ